MRGILILLAVIVVGGILAVATGFVNLSGDAGQLPKVSVDGGRAPTVNADVGSIDVGTKETSVTVPKVEVGTTQESVAVPSVEVKKADGQ